MRVDHAREDEENVAGWIATADLFFLTAILLMGLAGSAMFLNARNQKIIAEQHRQLVQQTQQAQQVQQAQQAQLDTLLKQMNSCGITLQELEALFDRKLAAKEWRELIKELRDRVKPFEQLEAELVELRELVSVQKARILQAEADLATAQAELAKARSEIAELRARNTQLAGALRLNEDQLKKIQGLLRQRSEQILRPLNNAVLVVRIRSHNLAENLDLDLYVQDPLDRICNWRNPRIQTDRAETATLIPSEYLRSIEIQKDGQADVGMTQEAYYSAELLPSSSANPYVVFCMLREVGTGGAGPPLQQEVDWEVEWKPKSGQIARLTGSTVIRQSGRVMVQATGDLYQRLFPLGGFYVPEQGEPELVQIPDDELPVIPRGWQKGRLKEGAGPFVKFADQNQGGAKTDIDRNRD